MQHHVSASSKTCAWGYFDAAREPVLTIDSGDTCQISVCDMSPTSHAFGIPFIEQTSGRFIIPVRSEA